MFNPTIIRICTIGCHTGMVIAPSNASDDNVFQLYLNKQDDKTQLIHAMPYSSQVGALNHFEAWARDESRNTLPQYHRFPDFPSVRVEPELDVQTNHNAPPLNDMDDPDNYEEPEDDDWEDRHMADEYEFHNPLD
jgi:hypothetical protein